MPPPVFGIIGSIFALVCVVSLKFSHIYLGLSFGILAVAFFITAIVLHFKKDKKTKPEISPQEFTFVDPPGYYTHPKYSYPICPACLNKTKLISPVSKDGYCTVCKEPISETLVSGGEVFTVPDPYDESLT